MTRARLAGSAHVPWVAPAVITAVVAVYILLYLQTPFGFWYEDDANVAAAVAQVDGPWTFFLSKEGLSLGVIGTQPVPFFNLSFWLDQQVAPRSPAFAYAHTAVSLWICALLLYRVAEAWVSPRWATALAVAWLALPGTICFAEYNSCRHFLEGFLWSLLAVLAARRALVATGGRAVAWAGAAAACYLCASLSKQLYVTTTFALVAATFAGRRRWGLLAPLAAAGAAYVGYHAAVLGLVNTYGHPMLSPREAADFLVKLPAILAGGPLGWLAAGVWAAAILLALSRRELGWRHLAGPAALLLITLVTVFPASRPLWTGWEAPGTWSRIAFLPATVVLFAGAWLLRRLGDRRVVAAVVSVTALTLAVGAEGARRHWADAKSKYEAEGRFYVAHPDKLLLSDVPAWWYIPGLHELYGVADPHYLLALRPDPVGDRAALARHDTLWHRNREKPPRVVERRDLYDLMARKVRLTE